MDFGHFQDKARNKTFFKSKILNEMPMDFVGFIICIKCVYNLDEICIKSSYILYQKTHLKMDFDK